MLQEPERQRESSGGGLDVQGTINGSLVRENLQGLSHSRGEFAPLLDVRQSFIDIDIDIDIFSALKCLSQDVGGGDRILNCQIDAYSSDRRHGMSCVSNTKKAGARPLTQPIDRDRQ